MGIYRSWVLFRGYGKSKNSKSVQMTLCGLISDKRGRKNSSKAPSDQKDALLTEK